MKIKDNTHTVPLQVVNHPDTPCKSCGSHAFTITVKYKDGSDAKCVVCGDERYQLNS